MELLKQYRILVTGHPDSGKSTLIKNLAEVICGKVISPDTLMREVHYTDGEDPDGNPDTRTIKCAKIIIPFERDFEVCFYDAPGHLEYLDQIRQGIDACDLVIALYNAKEPLESAKYFCDLPKFGKKPVISLFSHSDVQGFPCYDVENRKDFKRFSKELMGRIRLEMLRIFPHDIEKEAIDLVKENIEGKTLMFFSGGKDSAVGLKLIELAGKTKDVDVWMPTSGYDFPEVLKAVENYKKYFQVSIANFGNSLGRTYEKDGEFSMMEAKALSNEYFIEDNLEYTKTVCIQYRASDEGVRSKDYHISDRGKYKRFSPVFYFSESNIWRFLEKYDIPVCSLYFEGYRSLGDMPVTLPCMPKMESKTEIIEWIERHPNTNERDGRKKQDNSVPFGMEKLRNIGFF